jgi:hypothetical protein
MSTHDADNMMGNLGSPKTFIELPFAVRTQIDSVRQEL